MGCDAVDQRVRDEISEGKRMKGAGEGRERLSGKGSGKESRVEADQNQTKAKGGEKL